MGTGDKNSTTSTGSLLPTISFAGTFLIYPTAPRFYRFCIPDGLNSTMSAVSSTIT